jgi:hypothetical protein
MLPGFAPLMVSVGIHRMSWLLRFGQEWRGSVIATVRPEVAGPTGSAK